MSFGFILSSRRSTFGPGLDSFFDWRLCSPVVDQKPLYGFIRTNKLGFGPEFLGRVRVVTSVASLVGVALYNQLLKDVSLRKMFFWTTTSGSSLGFTQLLLVTGWNLDLGISDGWFSTGDSLILTVLGQVSFIPVLVLAANLCPPGPEATFFATLMSIGNGEGGTGDVICAWLTGLLGVTSEDFINLAMLLVLCNVSSLLPLPFLGFLPSETEMADAVEEAEKALSDSSKAIERWAKLLTPRQ